MTDAIRRTMPMAALPLVCFGLWAQPAGAQDDVEYPIVFDSGEPAQLRTLGVAEGGGKTAFPNKCYYYGDGGTLISVSDQFMERYIQEGFSLNSLCMGLVSGIRFDPETGERLPTYLVADLRKLREASRQGRVSGEKLLEQLEAGDVGEEQPLVVPRCFRRGLPYSDCDMVFDPMTGARMRAEDRQALRAVGEQVARQVTAKMRRRWWRRECTPEEEGAGERGTDVPCRIEVDRRDVRGFLRVEAHSVCELDDTDRCESWEAHLSFLDASPAFPEGFGYALYAEGGAGPSADSAAVKAALAGKKRATEARLAAVRGVLGKK